MKKKVLAAVIAMFTAFMLVACGGGMKSGNPVKDTSFKTDVKMLFGDKQTEALATVRRLSKGQWSAEFTAPKSLAGVTLAFADGNVTASYKGLAFSVPKSAVPVKAVLTEMFDAVDRVAGDTELSATKSGSGLEMKGTTDSGAFKMKFSEDGKPVTFEMPHLALVVEFGEFLTGSEAVATSAETTILPVESDEIFTSAPVVSTPTSTTPVTPATTPAVTTPAQTQGNNAPNGNNNSNNGNSNNTGDNASRGNNAQN
jgi:hypothetical protein